jgi:hypothetical protein
MRVILPASHRIGTVFLVASALLGACGGDREPTSRDGRSTMNFTNGPPSPGPNIVRINNSGSRVITFDPAQGLLAIHGRVKNLQECTDASTRVPVDIQIVRTPSEAQNMALLLKAAENDVAIYDQGNPGDLAPFDPVKFCGFIANVTPVYEGVVSYRLHINGQGSLNFQWGGSLTRVSDGATVHYVEHQHFVASGDGTGKWVAEEIRIQAH